MQKLILFLVIYLYPSRGLCVCLWKNLTLMSCSVCCPPVVTWTLLSAGVCKVEESYITVFVFISFPSPQLPVHRHMSFLPASSQKQAVARSSHPLVIPGRTLPLRDRRQVRESLC